MAEFQNSIDHRLIESVDRKLSFVLWRLRSFTLWNSIFGLSLILLFISSLFISNSNTSLLSSLLDWIVTAFWGQVLVLSAFSIRLLFYIYKKARYGFQEDVLEYVNSDSDSLITVSDGIRIKHGVHASTVYSLLYLLMSSGLLILTIFTYENRNNILDRVSSLPVDQETAGRLLDLVRPGLGSLLNNLTGDLLFLFYALVVILIFSLFLRSFELLFFGVRELNNQSKLPRGYEPTFYSEITGFGIICVGLAYEILFGRYQWKASEIVLHLILGISLSWPSVIMLKYLITSI